MAHDWRTFMLQISFLFSFFLFFYIIIKIFFNDLQLIWHHIAITVLCHQNAYNKPSSPLRRHEKWRHHHQRRWRQHGGQIPLHLRQIVSCKISCMLPLYWYSYCLNCTNTSVIKLIVRQYKGWVIIWSCMFVVDYQAMEILTSLFLVSP